jgi:hypothetical protein
LALREKTVSFWQCRFAPGTAADNETTKTHRPRAHSRPIRCAESRPDGVPTGRQQDDDDCPLLHRLWITLWTVCPRSLGRLWTDRKGVVVVDN